MKSIGCSGVPNINGLRLVDKSTMQWPPSVHEDDKQHLLQMRDVYMGEMEESWKARFDVGARAGEVAFPCMPEFAVTVCCTSSSRNTRGRTRRLLELHARM